MILPTSFTDADIACVDILIGVGIATVIMSIWTVYNDWKKR